VPRYAVALARALDEIAGEFPDLELELVTTAAGARAVAPRTLAVREVRAPDAGPGRILAEQVAAARARASLLHFFDLSGPLLAPRRPFVATVHDVSVLHGFSVARQAYKRRLYPWALRRARAVVAVSGFARDEVLAHFPGVAPERIRVVHSGPGLLPASAADADAGADGGYVLFVGTLTASKNLPFLIGAYGRTSAPGRLVLAGRPGERFEDVRAAIDRSPRRGDIELVHDADDAALDRLYRGAAALVLPSRYEGFGLTPLEAMSRGCPVLVSDIPALREVSGDGALVLALDDEAAWTGAIERVLVDADLRDELRRRGGEMVARYSWTGTARALCELFREVA
jgi:glycosyltransferase involved in cell wall biosynthesis